MLFSIRGGAAAPSIFVGRLKMSVRNRWAAAFAATVLAFGTAHAQTLRIGLAEDPDVLDPTLARTFVGRVVFAGHTRHIAVSAAPA